MNRKFKIFFLFFLLSMTPFIRGCGESFGFPFPALIEVLQFNADYDIISIPETIPAILNSLRSYETIILLVVNFLIACLLALNVLRSQKYPVWRSSFLTSLSMHLAAVWFMVALMCINITQPLMKKAAEFYGSCFGHYFFDIPTDIASVAIDRMLKPFNMLSIDITSRAWFVAVTTALAVVIYLLKKLVLKVYHAKSSIRDRSV